MKMVRSHVCVWSGRKVRGIINARGGVQKARRVEERLHRFKGKNRPPGIY